MQILVNADHTINASESLSERVESIVTDSASRFTDRITRVDVHLSDVNAQKHGANDKRCMMEAHIAGLAPVVVTDTAPTLIQAIDGAAEKLERALEHALGRIEDTAGPAPRDSEIASVELLDELEKQPPKGRSRH